MLANDKKYIFYFSAVTKKTLFKEILDILPDGTMKERQKKCNKTCFENNNPITTVNNYLCCPFCSVSSKVYDFIKPIDSWESIIEEYQKNLYYALFSSLYNDGYVDFKELIFNYIKDEIACVDNDNPRNEQNYICDNYMFENNDDLDEYFNFYIPASKFNSDENGIIFSCPHCKEKIKTKRVRRISQMYNKAFPDFLVKRLIRSSNWYNENTFLHAYSIKSEDKDDKISVNLISNHYLPVPDAKIYINQSSERVTFNTKTGQTYRFRVYDLQKKKIAETEKNMQRLINITYSTIYWIKTGITKDIAIKIANEIMKKLNINLDIEKIIQNTSRYDKLYDSTSISFFYLLKYLNRYGSFYKENFFIYLLNLIDLNNVITKKEKKKYVYEYRDVDKFNRYLKKNNISGKKLKRICIENPLAVKIISFYKTIGFKNYDIILSAVENYRLFYKICNSLYSDYIDNRYEYMKIFVTDYTQIKTEAELFKKIEENPRLLRDTASMYSKLKSKAEIAPNMYKELFSGNIKEIHDRISHILDNFKHQDYYINYTADELKLNGTVDKFSFKLAKTAGEMREVGKEMHICVGSYGDRALRKSCQIVFMRDTENNLQACIELRQTDNNKFELVQAKDFCNKVLLPEKKAPLVRWLADNKISFINCYDSRMNNLENIDAHPIRFICDNSSENYNIMSSKEECASQKIAINSEFLWGTLKENPEPLYDDFLDDWQPF